MNTLYSITQKFATEKFNLKTFVITISVKNSPRLRVCVTVTTNMNFDLV